MYVWMCRCVARTGGIRQRLQTITGPGMSSYMTGCTATSTRSSIWSVYSYASCETMMIVFDLGSVGPCSVIFDHRLC